MKRKSRITIIVVTALITFGSLFAIKGGMYKHHWQHHSERCTEVDHENNKSHFQFEKADEEALDQSNK